MPLFNLGAFKQKEISAYLEIPFNLKYSLTFLRNPGKKSTGAEYEVCVAIKIN